MCLKWGLYRYVLWYKSSWFPWTFSWLTWNVKMIIRSNQTVYWNCSVLYLVLKMNKWHKNTKLNTEHCRVQVHVLVYVNVVRSMLLRDCGVAFKYCRTLAASASCVCHRERCKWVVCNGGADWISNGRRRSGDKTGHASRLKPRLIPSMETHGQHKMRIWGPGGTVPPGPLKIC